MGDCTDIQQNIAFLEFFKAVATLWAQFKVSPRLPHNDLDKNAD